nr:TIM barrel protein [uncultured Sphaerochaeta sp.]
MLIPGLVSITCKQYTPQEILDLCSKTGLRAIEWSENWHLKAGDLKQAIHIGNSTRNAGLEVAAYGSYIRLGESGNINASMESAAALGAPVIRIWGGKKSSSVLLETELNEMVEQAENLAMQAKQYNLVVALEWHKETITDTNESALKFLDRVNMVNFKTLWQPTQALSVEERLQGLKMVQDKLMNLHVYHWNETGRRPLEEGAPEWKLYLQSVEPKKKHYALLEFVKDDDIDQLVKDSMTLLSWIS